MHTLHLNLLAPDKRRRLLELVRFTLSKEFLEIIIFTACLLAMAHLAGWLILVQMLTNLTESILSINRDSPTASHDIRTFNKLFKDILTSGADYTPLTPRILEFVGSLPPQIKSTAVVFDRQTNTITITGVAQNRIALLAYEEQLKRLPWVKGVSEPPSLLFQKENIAFEFTAGLVGFPALTPLPPAILPHTGGGEN